MLRRYRTPPNLLARLNEVVRAASETAFYSERLNGREGVSSLDEFRALPATPIAEYRRARLADTLSRPDEIEWIMGQYDGQLAGRLAAAEGPEESATRCDLFTDAVKERLSPQADTLAAVLAPPARRFFGAELCTALLRAGVTAHLFTQDGGERAYGRLAHVAPDVLVAPCDDLDEARLPESARLCVTFGWQTPLAARRQLDLLYLDGLGFLGQSADCRSYALNSDEYLFEASAPGRLVVTPLFNQVQPMIRIETGLGVGSLYDGGAVFVRGTASEVPSPLRGKVRGEG